LTKRLFGKIKLALPKTAEKPYVTRGKTLDYAQKEEEHEIRYATPTAVLLLDNFRRNKVDFLKIIRNLKTVDGDETKQNGRSFPSLLKRFLKPKVS